LAKVAIYDCVKQFGDYVNKLAVGNRIILELSTLPIDEPSDIEAKILAGATADLVVGTQGSTLQLITDCAAFGKDVGYITVVSEDEPIPEDLLIAANAQITMPLGLTHRVFASGTLARRKTYNGLVLGKKYYISTLLVYGDLVGAKSIPVMFVCSK
jgi:Ni,Fe-hydrogenase maturation factor